MAFVNTVLVGVVAFFVLLMVFWYAVELRPQEGVAVEGVSARWDGANAEGSHILVELSLHNPRRSAAQVTALDYEVAAGGKVMDQGTEQPDLGLPGRSDGTLRFAASLPDDFVVRWWPDYAESGEEGSLRIFGTLTVQQRNGLHSLPFSWESSWQGGLAEGLPEGAGNCAAGDGVCLAGLEMEWQESALRTTLELRNAGSRAAEVQAGSLRLIFADERVALGTLEEPVGIAPGDNEEVELDLVFLRDPMEAWWPGHVERCERSSTVLELRLEVAEAPEEPQPPPDNGNGTGANGTEGNATPVPEAVRIDWEFPTPPFNTRFICGRSA